MQITFLQVKGYRTAIAYVCLIFILFVGKGDISRVNNNIMNSSSTEVFMNSRSAEACFIGRIIFPSRIFLIRWLINVLTDGGCEKCSRCRFKDRIVTDQEFLWTSRPIKNFWPWKSIDFCNFVLGIVQSFNFYKLRNTQLSLIKITAAQFIGDRNIPALCFSNINTF